MPDFTYRPLTLDNYFDRIFYINLQRDTVRNSELVKQFSRFSITNYERFEAIELIELPASEKYRNFIKKDLKYILGQLSCKASHIECIKIAKQRNYSKVLILEDDVIFLDNPNHLLMHNQDTLREWDMLYFGGLIEPHFRNQIVCAHAYGVKNVIYDDIINMADASGMEIDNFYAKILHHMSYNYNRSGKYDIRIISPFNRIVQNKMFASNIQD
jgi:GR25 family glycosyltransferase involved in LPS biosynthesis